MLTSVLRRIRFLPLVMALATPTWSTCKAIGCFQTRPAFPEVARDGELPVLPTVAWPNVSERDFVGGCGKGRVRDTQTNGCRGPANIR
jgi:hypothetical protein